MLLLLVYLLFWIDENSPLDSAGYCSNDETPILYTHVDGKLTKSKRTLEFDDITGKHFTIIYLPAHI